MGRCSERDRLTGEAEAALGRVITLTREQINALNERDDSRLMALDQELELAFGEKERLFGALQQHTKEHGC